MQEELGNPKFEFSPWQFGGIDGTRHTKQTYLWGDFELPRRKLHPQGKGEGITSKLSSNQKRLRAVTPKGFAEAFFRANP
tara:strand:+ start:980 stop:1219 length:240 start_codon:yes stop_codon:yes gene_type:complete